MADIRPATAADSPVLARLIDMAGEGIPSYVWAQMAEPGETPLDVGRRRAAREEGSFSYRNAHVVDIGGSPVAMVLGYLQPDPYDLDNIESMPDFIRALVELEALAPGSWYVNALAALPEHRCKGYGARLLGLAGEVARDFGAADLSIIVDSRNTGARRLYERHGFAEVARRPIVPVAHTPAGGDWALMVRLLS